MAALQFFSNGEHLLASAAAYCHQLSCRSGKLPTAWAWGPAPEAFCLCSLLSLSLGGTVGALREQVHTPLHGAGSPPALWSPQGPETPWVSPQSPADLPRPAGPRLPRLSCCWQVLASKNNSGGDSSLGLKEGDESEEGRQLHLQTLWGWGTGSTPWRRSPRQLAERPGLLCCLGGGQRMCRQSRARPGAGQESAGASRGWGTLLLLVLADTQDTQACRAGWQCLGD